MALQRWRATMEYYVELDVSLKQTSMCVANETGLAVREDVVASDPEAISVFVRSKAPDAVRIGFETGPTSTWLWSELKRLGLPVICIDARHAKAVLKMQINKSDRNDAAGIARIMQTGWFKEVHVKDIDSQDCKGKFASGRTSELVDSDVVFRGFSSCGDSDGSRFSQYFIVSRTEGGFVMFSVVSNMETEEAKTVTKEEQLVDFKAALVAVGR
jgi:hypothetical protein